MNLSRWGTHSHIYKRASSPAISLCLDRQDAGESRDLARDIVIMDEICHLRWHLSPLPRSLSLPRLFFLFDFFIPFLMGRYALRDVLLPVAALLPLFSSFAFSFVSRRCVTLMDAFHGTRVTRAIAVREKLFPPPRSFHF